MNSDQTAKDGSIRVLKRDNSIEPFDFPKLLNCISNGFYASGETHDRRSATSRGLAEAVHAYLSKMHPDSAVPSEHLAELVELVLSQTGHTAASMAIKQHDQLRSQHRRWIRVAHRRGREGRFVQKRWNKSRLVEHLREDHALDAPASRMIASRVEQLIFNCGLKVVTTGLVEEMAASELLAWGLLPGALVVKKQRRRQGSPKVNEASDQA